jgi:hypothetical protein
MSEGRVAMSMAEGIGSIGVGLLLLGFVLNLSGHIQRDSGSYQSLNAVGAALSCYASYLIGFVPFVILEATWMLAALVALVFATRPSGSPRL